jgi:hypothetical protein
MATTLQFRRGNSAAAAAVTGANGEIYINTQTKSIHIHDGSTAGGFALANTSSVANASNLTTGTVPTARLGTGTANSTTVLYGNNVWAALPSANLSAVAQDVLPSFNDVYDLGSASKRWNDLFVSNNLNIDGAVLTSMPDGAGYIISTNDSFAANTVTANSALLGDVSIVGSTVSAIDSYGATQLLTVDGDLNVNGAFTVNGSAVGSYTLPTATTTTLGGVKVDGTTIAINNGVISAAGSYTLPAANTSALGGVKVDGTSIISNNGIISVGSIENVTSIAVQSGDVFINAVSSSVFYIQNPPYNFQATFGVPNELYTNGRAATYVLVIDQGSTPHIANTMAIGYSNPSISWQGGTTPTGNANKRDVISFTLMRQSDSWIVLGSLNTYG